MSAFGKMLKKINKLVVVAFCGLLVAGWWPPEPTLAVQAPSRGGVLLDLVFVIDNSGSMKKNDPNFITPQVVSAFIGQLPRQSQVGMVLFDENARLLMPLTPLTDSGVREIVDNGLARIDYRGQHTNTPVGIERALYELRVKGRPTAQKGILFITDGIVDTGDPRKDAELTRWLKQDLTAQSEDLGVRIFGIALTDAADFSLIQTLASRTHGEYFRTYEASEISSVFGQIQSRLTPAPPEVDNPAPGVATGTHDRDPEAPTLSTPRHPKRSRGRRPKPRRRLPPTTKPSWSSKRAPGC